MKSMCGYPTIPLTEEQRALKTFGWYKCPSPLKWIDDDGKVQGVQIMIDSGAIRAISEGEEEAIIYTKDGTAHLVPNSDCERLLIDWRDACDANEINQ